MRFLGYTMGDPSAPMTPPSPDEMAKMGTFVAEATKAGSCWPPAAWPAGSGGQGAVPRR